MTLWRLTLVGGLGRLTIDLPNMGNYELFALCSASRPYHRDMVTTHRMKHRMKSYCKSSDLLGSSPAAARRGRVLGCRFAQVSR